MIDSQAEVEALEQKAAQVAAEIRSLEAKRRETETAFRADASDKRLKALQKVVQFEQQIAKEQMREDKRRLVAPVTGTVLSLKAATIGGVVTAADTLMTIVPETGTLEIDAQIQNKDIGYLSEGQPVEVKLETYPFTRYGTVPGRVRKLGRDAVKSDSQGTPLSDPKGRTAAAANAGPTGEFVYPARIELLRNTIQVEGREMPITSGMKVTAEIKTEDRRVIQYILDPVLATLKQAGRER